jgi:hypothetical protein
MSKSLSILPLKEGGMKNNRWSDIEHIIAHPFTMAIHAPSRSGKSVVLSNFLYNEAFNFKKRFDKIIFISPTILIDQTLQYARDDEDVVKIYEDDLLENLDNVLQTILAKQKKEKDSEKPNATLIILDDCLAYLKNKSLSYLSTKNRHYNISLIMTTQYYKRLDPVIRANATHWLLFKTHTDKEHSTIVEDFNSFPEFEKQYIHATSEPYSFLFADMLKMRLLKRFEGEPLYDKIRDFDKYNKNEISQ